jgi:hypothetical protein
MPIQGPTDGLVEQLLKRLETLSRRLEKTIVITSGRRTGDVNASAHNSGIAADFYVAGMKSIALADEIVDEGFTGVGEYYNSDSVEERFAHADIRGLPGSEGSGAYGPGGSKSAPLCWYRIGENYSYGSRRSGRRCPNQSRLADYTSVSNVDPNAPDEERVSTMRTIIAQVVDDLDTTDRENKKNFMLHVAWHEGAFLKRRVQNGGGPGRSFFQMEPPRSWDAYEWAEQNRWLDRLTRSSGLSDEVLRRAARDLPRTSGIPWPNGNLIEAKLGGTFDLFATYMARIALKRLSQTIGNSNRDHAVYWADNWKIDFPAGDRVQLIDRFEQEADHVDKL